MLRAKIHDDPEAETIRQCHPHVDGLMGHTYTYVKVVFLKSPKMHSYTQRNMVAGSILLPSI